MKKEILNRFRIKRKRDWVVFWIFAALLCYVLGGRFLSFEIKDWLFQNGNPYMTSLNDPAPEWGRLMIALMLLALVGEAVLLLCRRNRKGAAAMAGLLAAACVVPFAVLGSYKIHTYLIVSPLWKEEPQSVSMWLKGDEGSGENRILYENLSEPQKQELLKFCKNMTIVSDKEEKQMLEEWYRETPSAFQDAGEIYIRYNRKYGHSYSFILRIYEDKVFIWRGNGKQSGQYVTFFEDNGLAEWLEKLQNV